MFISSKKIIKKKNVALASPAPLTCHATPPLSLASLLSNAFLCAARGTHAPLRRRFGFLFFVVLTLFCFVFLLLLLLLCFVGYSLYVPL
jgi:hypothetical protein